MGQLPESMSELELADGEWMRRTAASSRVCSYGMVSRGNGGRLGGKDGRRLP